MQDNKTANIILLVVGVGLFVVSLLADVIGIGGDPGFGRQQTMGIAAGVILAALGLYLIFYESPSAK